MKVLVIMGSPHKGNTYAAAKKIEESMRRRSAVEFDYLMLSEANLSPCRGCFVCFMKGEGFCPIEDDASLILQRLEDADGVIFASPVFGMNVTGLMKTFIDRFSYVFHRPRFFEKKALLLSTTGALGQKDVIKYLDMVARIWGFEVVTGAGLITPRVGGTRWFTPEQEDELDLAGKKFLEALRRKTRRSPSFMDVIVFHAQRCSFNILAEEAPLDHEYWKEHGWFDPGRRYYVDVRVNPLYNFIGLLAERVFRRRIERDRIKGWYKSTYSPKNT
ncbi:multimeric flavodoxin WrbA [Methanolinea mesophila]|uniref:flavodoxin family protein n=1 Tax=Methanolinea mesophila TaxID=547055 RepID=UPI001AE70479|nr:flavodoxin family protein [Methanolinea mesophila]MBP1929635.1 multimeric flavodoxin WrbA [Methanolinea mesophila]